MSAVYKLAPFCLLVTLVVSSQAASDVSSAACAGDSLTVVKSLNDGKDLTSEQGGLKDSISVMVKGLSNCLKQRGSPVPKFTLYLDGKPLKGLETSTYGVGHDHLNFLLDRVGDNKDTWSALLRNPTLKPRPVALTIAVDDLPPARSEIDRFNLKVVNGKWLTAWTLGFLITFVLFLWAAVASDILREAGPPPLNNHRKAFSLARCQMAFWFFLIAMAFCLVFMITWDVDTISQGVLALMGISAATGLAGAVVDASKNADAESQMKDLSTQRAALAADPQLLLNFEKTRQMAVIDSKMRQVSAQLETPATAGFVHDLLSDATGISFHRFQIFVWTIILGVVFVARVKSDLVMPDFGLTLLGLMGISSGTYIGFKFPEQKNPSS